MRDVAGVVPMLLIGLPALLAAEGVAPQRAPPFAVTSVVEVNAPPQIVWQRVIAFPDLPPPRELAFRAGIAYPIRVPVRGAGPDAIRRCEFSTGTFVEPIEVWDAPRQLKFGVTHNPPPLREWSPYASIHPPHLDDFLVAEAGEFKLTELPGGRTRLEGTTWYRHNLWPAAYWRLWSDALIHRIHLRVLEHIKKLSEATNSEVR